MKSLIEFPQTLTKSLTSPAFYQDVLGGKTGGALKYFLILTILLGIIKSSLISIAIIPPIQEFISKLSQNVPDLFPADLVVTIESGQVATNAKDPYAIPLSALDKLFPQAKSDLNQPNTPQIDNLVVIATSAATSDFPKYKTMILVTKSGFVVPDNETSGFRYYPLPQDASGTIDRRLVRSLWSQYSPMLKWAIPSLMAVIWIWFILWYPSWYLTYLVFGTILVKLFLKLSKTEASFGSLYRVGLFSITLPALIIFFLDIFSIPIPFLFTLIFVAFTIYMLRKPTVLPKA